MRSHIRKRFKQLYTRVHDEFHLKIFNANTDLLNNVDTYLQEVELCEGFVSVYTTQKVVASACQRSILVIVKYTYTLPHLATMQSQ